MRDEKINAVSVALFDKNQRVLLIKRAREPYAGHWSFAGGRVERDEQLERTAHREIEEELGLSISDLIEVGTADMGAAGHPFYLKNYACNSFHGEIVPAPDEILDWRFFTLDQIQCLITTPNLASWAQKAHSKLFAAS